MHIGATNLPKVATQPCPRWGSNPRPNDTNPTLYRYATGHHLLNSKILDVMENSWFLHFFTNKLQIIYITGYIFKLYKHAQRVYFRGHGVSCKCDTQINKYVTTELYYFHNCRYTVYDFNCIVFLVYCLLLLRLALQSSNLPTQVYDVGTKVYLITGTQPAITTLCCGTSMRKLPL